MSLDKNQWSYARFQQTPDGIAAWLSEKAERAKCFTNTFGFCTYWKCRVFFEEAFQEQAEQDESGLTTLNNKKRFEDGRIGLGFRIPFFDQFLCTLWKFKAKRVTRSMLATWFGVNPRTISAYLNRWCPLLGAAGRSLVWLPSSQYLRDSQPKIMKENDMHTVVLAGDCTGSH